MKSITKRHTTTEGEIVTRKIVVDDQDYNFVKQNLDSVYVDVYGDVPRMYNPHTGKTLSLGRAILLNRKKKVSGKVMNLSGDPYDVRTQNLVCK
jgi:hypothetical protein